MDVSRILHAVDEVLSNSSGPHKQGFASVEDLVGVLSTQVILVECFLFLYYCMEFKVSVTLNLMQCLVCWGVV